MLIVEREGETERLPEELVSFSRVKGRNLLLAGTRYRLHRASIKLWTESQLAAYCAYGTVIV